MNIFYFLVFYVLAFFIWWTIYHFQQLGEQHRLYLEKAELAEKYTKLDPDNTQYSKFARERADREYHRRTMMIVGEGGVFFIILLFAAYWIHAGFKKELMFNEQQRNFMLSITHELKSPLSGIKLATETLLSRVLDRDKQYRLLSNTRKDTERLQNLVENILLAAKIENQSMQLDKSETCLSDLVEDTANKLKENFGQMHKFNFEIQKDINVMGDKIALVSIVTNLVENAIKYSPPQTTVSVALSAVEQITQLIVADEGSGIPDAEKAKVFNKFYRIGSEDTRKTKGTGLGLFLVKELVEMHSGKIKISDNLPRGAAFVVELPCLTSHLDTDDDYAPSAEFVVEK